MNQERRPKNEERAPRVVIVGGGFGGLSAARRLRHAPVRITLLDRLNHHLFQPLLYQVATAALSPGDIASPIRWILSAQQNVQVLMAEATSVDLERRVISLDRGELAYDYLIVATGARHAYFGHEEWQANAPGLKTLADALEIRRRVLTAFEAAERETDPDARRRLLTFVIVGGGPTGVELAGALIEITRRTLAHDFRSIRPETARIILVEAASSILAAFPHTLQQAARRSLQRLGVELREQTMVTGIDQGGVQIGADKVPSATVLWAAGVAASGLGRTLGVPLDKAGRVIVEGDLSVAGHPEVFVVGDLAAFLHQGGKPLPGVAQVAKQQAAHAASNVVRRLRRQRTQPFHYRNYGNMATIGRGAAVADFGWLRLSGYVAWLAWLFVHVMSLVGFRNRIAVFSEWAWAYLTEQRRVRLITSR